MPRRNRFLRRHCCRGRCAPRRDRRQAHRAPGQMAGRWRGWTRRCCRSCVGRIRTDGARTMSQGAAISEYVDVAKAFFDDREAKFVNGILDARQAALSALAPTRAASTDLPGALLALQAEHPALPGAWKRLHFAAAHSPLHPAREVRDDCAVLELGGETLDPHARPWSKASHEDAGSRRYRVEAGGDVNLSDLAAEAPHPLACWWAFWNRRRSLR